MESNLGQRRFFLFALVFFVFFNFFFFYTLGSTMGVSHKSNSSRNQPTGVETEMLNQRSLLISFLSLPFSTLFLIHHSPYDQKQHCPQRSVSSYIPQQLRKYLTVQYARDNFSTVVASSRVTPVYVKQTNINQYTSLKALKVIKIINKNNQLQTTYFKSGLSERCPSSQQRYKYSNSNQYHLDWN